MKNKNGRMNFVYHRYLNIDSQIFWAYNGTNVFLLAADPIPGSAGYGLRGTRRKARVCNSGALGYAQDGLRLKNTKGIAA